MQSLKQRLRDDFPRLAFTGAFLLAAAGTCVVLGGLAAVTNFCIENQPLGLGSGFKLEAPLTPFATELMRILRAPVSTETGAFSCGRFFRYDWFLWAFQLVWLCIVGAAWYRGTVDRYKSALWAIGATVTAWHMYKIDFICKMDFWTKGEVHTDGLITAGGLIMCCLGNFFMMLAGCAYAEVETARAAAAAAADGTSSEEDVKRGGGKSVGSFSTAV